MSTCYTIRAGQVSRQPIPTDGLPLLRRSVTDLTAYPGNEDSDWEGYTLNVVTEIAGRLTPWATWYCSPDARNGDSIGTTTWGWADGSRDVAWLRSSRHPDSAVQGALHEAYHLAENWLTGDEIDVLRQAAERGPIMPRQTDYNDYWCSDVEVRARGFSAWAYSMWLMGAEPEYRWRMPAHERLWTMIYVGDLGLRAARRGRIRRELMPPALRQRLAERSDSQKLYDAARHVALGAWRLAKAAWNLAIDPWMPNTPPMAPAKLGRK